MVRYLNVVVEKHANKLTKRGFIVDRDNFTISTMFSPRPQA
jgi:hypothetical protein